MSEKPDNSLTRYAVILGVAAIMLFISWAVIRPLTVFWYNDIIDKSAPVVELRATVQAMQTQIAR